MNYEQFLIALMLWREARGQSQAARSAILAVVRNRAADERRRWPRSMARCILQAKQFSSFNADDPNAVKFPLPPDSTNPSSPDWAAWQQCCDVVETTLRADPTDGANHYESCAAAGLPLPKWADQAKKTISIGPFNFYRL